MIRIGTSGWIYKHWRGVFYPPNMKEREWFFHYSKHFDTVEINATFYRIPRPEVFKGWFERAPDKFIYAVKLSRLITHRKKLTDCGDILRDFLLRARNLGEKLGPILIQLPPSLKKDREKLESFLKLLPEDLIFAVEFRNKSWFSEDIYETLDRYKVGFVTFHHPYLECPIIVTGKLVYLRFHGMGTLYSGRYGKENLDRWAEFLKKYEKEGFPCFVYFNNDFGGNAILDAKDLKELLNL
jgi:uncharacterized protein YecE (DUF72 family)